MSKSFARVVFAVTMAFFAVFFLWPVLQILKGGFLDADGHLTGLGHIGMIEELDPANEGTYSIEGNTNSEGSRTGGGVWRHTPRVRLLSYWNLGFWDWSAAVPRACASAR